MRIYLNIKSDNCTIPFSHQHLLVGTIHKWLGWNQLHGNKALFSFSRIEKGKSTSEGLKLGDFCSMYFSAHDDTVIKNLIRGIQTAPTMFNKLNVTDILIQENPDFSNQNYFSLGSPVFIKRNTGDTKTKHFIYSEKESSELLIETLKTKMKVAGISDDTLEIYFDQAYPNPQVKLIDYNGIKNRVNWCPVIINGKPETKLFAWNVGLGNSTGIGFGAIK